MPPRYPGGDTGAIGALAISCCRHAAGVIGGSGALPGIYSCVVGETTP